MDPDGRAIAQTVSSWLPYFKSGYSHVGFVVDKMALGVDFLRVLRFPPANLHSTNFSTITITYHSGLVQ
jgi:hypothetical protein